MDKDTINSKLRDYVKLTLSPLDLERRFIGAIYEAFDVVLEHRCLQIGSFARFTAIRPIHDLDILYVIGNWREEEHNPADALRRLHSKIQAEFRNPTKYSTEISLQTHSVTVLFKQGEEEVFSVDVVPAYILAKNEFGDEVYRVPEILRLRHGSQRLEYYKAHAEDVKELRWIPSDPRGYIEIARAVNQRNSDFRKAVKFVKAWKNACDEKTSHFGLKSFHVEQVVTTIYLRNPDLQIFDAVFQFFLGLPESLHHPQIPDRADPSTYIDQYLDELTLGQKERIIGARDALLIALEEFRESDSIAKLLEVHFYRRASAEEQYLFDFGIPILLDDKYAFEIAGHVQARPGFRPSILGRSGEIPIDRKINFRIAGKPPQVDSFKWKVKNDDLAPQPRGEITDNQTRNDPEHTKYKGHHFVECFAIHNNACVARARQNVVLKSIY